MTIALIQTTTIARFDVAFHDGINEREIEGYIVGTEVGDGYAYMPFNLDDLPLAVEPISNPVEAAVLVIRDYAQREIEVIDRHLADLREEEKTASGLRARFLPRRIASSLAYRQKVLSGIYA